MDKKDVKKLLAGMSLVALIGGAGLTTSGCVATTGGGTANGQQEGAADSNGIVINPDGSITA